jgi:hypothetical protein
MTLTLATQSNWELFHLDVKTIFFEWRTLGKSLHDST